MKKYLRIQKYAAIIQDIIAQYFNLNLSKIIKMKQNLPICFHITQIKKIIRTNGLGRILSKNETFGFSWQRFNNQIRVFFQGMNHNR